MRNGSRVMMQWLCDIKTYISACFFPTPEINFIPLRNVTLFYIRAKYPYKSAMSTITLSCLVVGENPYENAFNVKINKTEAVSELRDAIKEKNTQAFANVDA